MIEIEINDSEQMVTIECHVSKRLFELSAGELVDAICLWQETKAEMEGDNGN